jgi:23S rRNA (guanosine2251-2'-O)-methyltransferase
VIALRVGRRSDRRLEQLLILAGQARVPIRRVTDEELDREARGWSHQGVLADLAERETCDLDDLIGDARATPPALIVVLDGIEDPQNFGAILRSVDAVGAHGVVRQTRHAAALGAAATKASAGAVAHVRIADVVNIARALEALKEAGIWTVGLAGDAEATGLRRLVRERCDVLARIPMAGHVDSLNVSVAAGVVLFEARRQRNAGRPRST